MLDGSPGLGCVEGVGRLQQGARACRCATATPHLPPTSTCPPPPAPRAAVGEGARPHRPQEAGAGPGAGGGFAGMGMLCGVMASAAVWILGALTCGCRARRLSLPLHICPDASCWWAAPDASSCLAYMQDLQAQLAACLVDRLVVVRWAFCCCSAWPPCPAPVNRLRGSCQEAALPGSPTPLPGLVHRQLTSVGPRGRAQGLTWSGCARTRTDGLS
jgi:hypothetical protein